MSRRRAFTLVELLVVIAIIGLLSTVAVVATANARIKARNTKRIADIRQIITALNMGYAAEESFPASAVVCISSVCTGGYSGYPSNSTVNSFLSPYIPNKAVYPLPAPGYGGYLYVGSFAGTIGVDGNIPAGPIVAYMLEGDVSCVGLGIANVRTSAYTECIYNLS